MMALDILLDGLFAAVAAIGFGAISDPPMRAFPRIALLAAVGHALRYWLMHGVGIDIASASLCAAMVIGFGSLWLGRGVRCPMTVLYIPALLPMVPGIYAYKSVFSLIMFLQSLNDPGQGMQYMQLFFLNATVSLSVIALLAAGATLPIFVFKKEAFSLTRRRRTEPATIPTDEAPKSGGPATEGNRPSSRTVCREEPPVTERDKAEHDDAKRDGCCPSKNNPQ